MNLNNKHKSVNSKSSYQGLARQSLGFFPTPLIELVNLSRALKGPRIFIKRDDQSGLAMGGNKTRKLEYLVADALQKGCDTLITGGAAQSNHCRQTAAATAQCGLHCHLVLGGKAPKHSDGNLLLDKLLGAQIHWSGSLRKGENIPEIAARLTAQGRRPYIIPYGGSNALGAIGFVTAFDELTVQAKAADVKFSNLIFASSSGGTHAGLVLGKLLSSDSINITGISIEKPENTNQPFAELIFDLIKTSAASIGVNIKIALSDIQLRDEFVGQGYGIVGKPEREAIAVLARTEGILLDPVYTARAMAGLIAMVKAGEFNQNENILFWHTGGAPALFPYADNILGKTD